MTTRKQRSLPKLKLIAPETDLPKLTLEHAAHTVLGSRYAQIAQEILETVKPLMDRPAQMRRSYSTRQGIKVNDILAAEMLLKHYDGDIDRIIADFIVSGRRTLDSFKALMVGRDIAPPTAKIYKRAVDRIASEAFKAMTAYRLSEYNRELVSADAQRLYTALARYIDVKPDTTHETFLKLSPCASCGKQPHTDNTTAVIKGEVPIMITLCHECNAKKDSTDFTIDWKYTAENYYALSQYLGRILNDITGNSWNTKDNFVYKEQRGSYSRYAGAVSPRNKSVPRIERTDTDATTDD